MWSDQERVWQCYCCVRDRVTLSVTVLLLCSWPRDLECDVFDIVTECNVSAVVSGKRDCVECSFFPLIWLPWVLLQSCELQLYLWQRDYKCYIFLLCSWQVGISDASGVLLMWQVNSTGTSTNPFLVSPHLFSSFHLACFYGCQPSMYLL